MSVSTAAHSTDKMELLTSKDAAVMASPDVLAYLRTDGERGLTAAEVERRQRIYGFNEMTIHEEEPLLLKYINQVSICYENSVMSLLM